MSGSVIRDISVEVRPVDDPVGFAVRARLVQRVSGGQRALMDEVERATRNRCESALEVADGRLMQYSNRVGHDIDDIAESSDIVTDQSDEDTVEIRCVWTHERSALVNYGVGPYVIRGQPILSFIWENAPQSVHDMFPDTERVSGDPRVFFPKTRHPGVPAARFIQAASNWLRNQMTRDFA